MATRQSQKVEPPKVIGAISQFAGALVGTAVVTGKRIVKTAAQAGEGPLSGPGGKSTRTQAKSKKKAAIKTKAKGRKVRKKAAKKKITGPRRKSKTSGKRPTKSPVEK
jgi:hypothetical protein